MKWTPTGRDEAREHGKQTSPGAVTLKDTEMRLRNILRFVSTEVCVFFQCFRWTILNWHQNEAGCRLIINELLVHIAWNLDTEKSGVAIAPEFRVGNTVLESNTRSYGGVVDYMVAVAPLPVRGAPLDLRRGGLVSKPP